MTALRTPKNGGAPTMSWMAGPVAWRNAEEPASRAIPGWLRRSRREYTPSCRGRRSATRLQGCGRGSQSFLFASTLKQGEEAMRLALPTYWMFNPSHGDIRCTGLGKEPCTAELGGSPVTR